MIVWESFQHPCETFLSNMKVSANRRTGDKVQFTSWKSLSDPSVGSFSSSLNVVNVPEVFVWNETRPYWRSGPWNGKIFIGIPKMKPVYLNGFRLGGDGEGTYTITLTPVNDSRHPMLVLNSQGKLVFTVWGNKKDEQIIRWTIQQSECDVYGLCGEFGICNSQRSPLCSCLRGFEPMDKEEWNRQNWTSGCVRTTPVQCGRMRNGGESGKEDGFLKFKMVKLPDFAEWSIAEEDQCRTQCLKNCSCISYGYDTEIGCTSWSRNLIDIQKFSDAGVNLYVHVAHSELEKEKDLAVSIAVPVTIGIIIIAISACLLWKWTARYTARKKKNKGFLLSNTQEDSPKVPSEDMIGDLQVELQELPLFFFEKLATVTNNFNLAYKLGEGGFGSVYKGTLEDGVEIAVKRLSRTSD